MGMNQHQIGHGWRQSDLESLYRSALPISDSKAQKKREKMYQQLLKTGWPTRQWSGWRNSKMHAITTRDIQHVEPRTTTVCDQIPKLVDAINIVLVNGEISQSDSDCAALPEGVSFEKVTDSQLAYEESINRLNCDDSPFVQMSMFAARFGYVLKVDAGVVCKKPLHIIHIDSAETSAEMIHAHNILLLGENSKVTVIQQHVSAVETPVLQNKLTHVICAKEAEVDFVKWQHGGDQQSYFSNIHFNLSVESKVFLNYLNAGVALGRDVVRCWFEGEGAEFDVKALCLTGDNTKQDFNTQVFHCNRDCKSSQFIRSVCDGASVVNVHGGIWVGEGAEKTQADFQNKNLLLSSSATANTKPDLEIYNDNVMCTHGATVGMINEDSLFYLRSRGLSLSVARRMLLSAFVNECYQSLGYESVDSAIYSWLENCLMNRGEKNG
jgi:Fe-S cluster assembly protein SufD